MRHMIRSDATMLTHIKSSDCFKCIIQCGHTSGRVCADASKKGSGDLSASGASASDCDEG
jgi:hypothetical protein